MFFEDKTQVQIDILLVEDCRVRASEVRQALTEGNIAGRLHRVGDIDEALAYLRQAEPYYAAPLPDCVLLGERIGKQGVCKVAAEQQANSRLSNTLVLALQHNGHENVVETAPGCGGGWIVGVPLRELSTAISQAASDPAKLAGA